jgi:uncharacterized protein YeaO (DUF488 family)
MAAKGAGDIRIKRAYEPPAEADGARVLVDRLWPRGITKAALAIERWVKEIGPSDELRRWFGHDPARWEEFRRRYTAALAKQTPLLAELRSLARDGTLTLVYGARDEAHNNAVVLRAVLLKTKTPAAAKPAAGASRRKSAGASTRRAASRRARRSPRR